MRVVSAQRADFALPCFLVIELAVNSPSPAKGTICAQKTIEKQNTLL